MPQQGIFNVTALGKQEIASAGNDKGTVDKHKQYLMAMIIAYLALLDTENISTQSTMVKAKELASNAAKQEQLNREAAQLKWSEIPKEQVNWHEKTIAYWTTSWNIMSGFFHHKKVWYPTYPNQNAIAQAEMNNQLEMTLRQQYSNSMTVLEQSAKVQTSEISTQADEGIQALKELTNIMLILQSLTFKALMRHEPQV